MSSLFLLYGYYTFVFLHMSIRFIFADIIFLFWKFSLKLL